MTLEDVRAVMGDEAEARIEEALDARRPGRSQAARSRARTALDRRHLADRGRASGAVAFPAPALVNSEIEQAATPYRRARCASCARRSISCAPTSFKNPAQRWNDAAASRRPRPLLDTEALCKTTAMPAEAACGRALFNVAAMARAR